MRIRVELTRPPRARAIPEGHGDSSDPCAAKTANMVSAPERMEIGDDDPDDHQSQIGDVWRRDVHDDGVEIQLAEHRLAAIELARLVIARVARRTRTDERWKAPWSILASIEQETQLGS